MPHVVLYIGIPEGNPYTDPQTAPQSLLNLYMGGGGDPADRRKPIPLSLWYGNLGFLLNPIPYTPLYILNRSCDIMQGPARLRILISDFAF